MAERTPADNAAAAAAAAVDRTLGDTVPAERPDDDTQVEGHEQGAMQALLAAFALLRSGLASAMAPLTMLQLGALLQTGDGGRVPLRQVAAPLALTAAIALAFWPTTCRLVWLAIVHYALVALTIGGPMAADKTHSRLARGQDIATAVLVPHGVLLACFLWCLGVPHELLYGQWPVVSLLGTLQLPAGVETSEWPLLDAVALCFYVDWCGKLMAMCVKTATTLCVYAGRTHGRTGIGIRQLYAALRCVDTLFSIYRRVVTVAVWLSYVGAVNVPLQWAIAALYTFAKLVYVEVDARDAAYYAQLAAHPPDHTPAQAGGKCPICLGPVKFAIRLPCTHTFCEQCIMQWLDRSAHCPYCRSNPLHGDISFVAYMPPTTSKSVLIF